MQTRFDPAEIIARYNAAFEAANNETGPIVTYERGWFKLRQYGVTSRFRRVDIQDMTGRLERRSASPHA